jgi:hypothetical protein
MLATHGKNATATFWQRQILGFAAVKLGSTSNAHATMQSVRPESSGVSCPFRPVAEQLGSFSPRLKRFLGDGSSNDADVLQEAPM